MKINKHVIKLTIAIASVVSLSCAQTPTAPTQPTSGPGGSTYPYAEVQTYGPFTRNTETGDVEFYYIYQPAGPVPASTPAVLFLHGYGADTPISYQRWIDHMVKMGYTVVWVLYDQSGATTFIDRELYDWADALARIAKSPGMVPITMGENNLPLTAVVGHSAGAFTSFALAARVDPPASTYPPMRAIVAIEPGQGQIPTYDLSAINPNTPIVIVVGDQDRPSRRCEASQIWQALPGTSAPSRNFLELISDARGTPEQIGNHYFSLTDTSLDTVPPPDSVDDRDYNISWKLSVAALNCAFTRTDCDTAFGFGNSQQITMGNWSNGVPVTPLLYVSDPVTHFQTDCNNKDGAPDGFEAPR